MTEQPALFWGLIASMWIGNVFLIILNLPLIGIWIYFLKVPYAYLFPAILVFCAIGVFTLSNAQFDVYTMAFFGALGYVFLKLGCEPAPLLLGFILGPLMEENLRRAMQISGGDAFVFFQRPISATILVLSLAMLASVLLPAVRRTREVAFQED
jgi:TctA family transporter